MRVCMQVGAPYQPICLEDGDRDGYYNAATPQDRATTISGMPYPNPVSALRSDTLLGRCQGRLHLKIAQHWLYGKEDPFGAFNLSPELIDALRETSTKNNVCAMTPDAIAQVAFAVGDFAVREEAIIDLSWLGAEQYVPQLSAVLWENLAPITLHEAAAAALIFRGGTEGLRALMPHVTNYNTHPHFRRLVVGLVAANSDQALAAQLLSGALLHDPDSNVRFMAAAELGSIANCSHASDLSKAAWSDPDENVRKAAEVFLSHVMKQHGIFGVYCPSNR